MTHTPTCECPKCFVTNEARLREQDLDDERRRPWTMVWPLIVAVLVVAFLALRSLAWGA